MNAHELLNEIENIDNGTNDDQKQSTSAQNNSLSNDTDRNKPFEFIHVVNPSEINANYLNLTDEDGKKYGFRMGHHDTLLLVYDGFGEKTFMKRHYNNQLTKCADWFYDNKVKPYTKVLFRFDPEGRELCRLGDEEEKAYPILHLAPLEDKDGRRCISEQNDEQETIDKENSTELVDTKMVGGGSNIFSEIEEDKSVLMQNTDSTNESRSDTLEQIGEDSPSEKIIIQYYVENNLHLIESGLEIYVDKEHRKGKQYPSDVGKIGLICKRKNQSLLIVDIVSKGDNIDTVLGRLSRQIGWVIANRANGVNVEGIILVPEKDIALEYAVLANSKLSIAYYKLQVEISLGP